MATEASQALQYLNSRPTEYPLTTIPFLSTMTVAANQAPKATDPAVYESYAAQWVKLPSSEEAWIDRAREVAAVLAKDATARDAANASPVAEVALLKHSGLLKVLGKAKYGGGGQPFGVGYKVIREVAKGDG